MTPQEFKDLIEEIEDTKMQLISSIEACSEEQITPEIKTDIYKFFELYNKFYNFIKEGK